MKTKNQIFLGLILVILTSSAIHSQVDFKCLQGNCENGIGKAVYYFEDTTYYEGQFLNGNWNGKGEINILGKYRYKGDFVENLLSGFGTVTFAEGTKYEGNVLKGDFEGQGTLYYSNGEKFTGIFKNGKIESGTGFMEINSKSFYKGGFKNGLKNGKGFIKFDDGANYDGNFENDLFSGYGIAIYADGGKYIGNWSENKQNGSGKLLDASGNIIFDGEWQDGNPKPVKPIKLSGYDKFSTVFKGCYNGNQTLTVFEEKIAAKLQMCLVLNSDLTINGLNTVSINIEGIIYECEYYVEGSIYESDNSFRLTLTSIKSSDTLPYGLTWENTAIINGTIYSEKSYEYLLQGTINDEDFDVTNY